MTTTVLERMPTNGDINAWDDSGKALAEAMGLMGEKNVQRNGNWTKVQFVAPRSIVEAFRHQIDRTGLDPIARQIYCIERGGKWGIQASIDGFRLIAERSNHYRGQTPAQWTDGTMTKVPLREDGKLVRDSAGDVVMVEDFRWFDVWADESKPPVAARIGIYRDDFAEPIWAVATFSGYCPRDKDNNLKPTGQWVVNPSNQLLKCAEMLGLRKAFPQDLSGIYGTEEMDQATRSSAPTPARASSPAIVPPVRTRDWAAEADKAGSYEELKPLYEAAEQAGELGLGTGRRNSDLDESPEFTVGQYLRYRKDDLLARSAAEGPEPLVTAGELAPRRQWVREGRALTDPDELRELIREAVARSAPAHVVEELNSFLTKMPEPAAEQSEGATVTEWPTTQIPTGEEPTGGDAA